MGKVHTELSDALKRCVCWTFDICKNYKDYKTFGIKELKLLMTILVPSANSRVHVGCEHSTLGVTGVNYHIVK